MKLIFLVFSFLVIQITKEAQGDCNDSINPGDDAKKCYAVEIDKGALCCFLTYKTDSSSNSRSHCKRFPTDQLAEDKISKFVKNEYGLIYVSHLCNANFISTMTSLAFAVALFF